VQCCVTSPPYWGLRDYGHDGQIGLEETPDAYVERMVEVFREVRRVLRNDGTLWLNLGDSYAASMNGRFRNGHGNIASPYNTHTDREGLKLDCGNLKPKDLAGIPWRVAFALQADGWWLRQDIIWHKPNPMPESVTDRCTKAHEYLFLLTKSARYYYDAEAVSEPASYADCGRPSKVRGEFVPKGEPLPGRVPFRAVTQTRNRRSVWTITTKPYSGAHFAVMPADLVEPCVKAGSRAAGKRCDCDEVIRTPLGDGESNDPTMQTGRAGMNRVRRDNEGTRLITVREQRGHAEQMRASPHRERMEAEAGSAFAHYIRTDSSGARPLPLELLNRWTAAGWITPVDPCGHPEGEPDTVLDPFAGSGTTLAVALNLGRHAVGCELNADYAKLAEERIAAVRDKTALFDEVAG